MAEEELESLKKEIRSLLITFQKGCLLSEFSKDYRNMLGHTLPFRKFGFKSEFDLLLSMKDVVTMNSFNNNDCHLIGVADTNTAHIQNMVSKQKPSTKVKLRPRAPTSYPKYTSYSQRHTTASSYRSAPRRNTFAIPSGNVFAPTPKRNTFASTSNRVAFAPTPNIEAGTTTPSKDSSAHVKYSCALTSSRDSFSTCPSPTSPSSKTGDSASISSRNVFMPTSSKDISTTSSNRARCSYSGKESFAPALTNRDSTSIPIKRNSESAPYMFKCETPPRFKNANCVVRKAELPLELKNDITCLIYKYPTGLKLTDFFASYRRFYQKEFGFKEYGFYTLDECLKSIPEIFLESKCDEMNDILIFVKKEVKRTIIPPESTNVLTYQDSSKDTGQEPYVYTPGKSRILDENLDRYFQQVSWRDNPTNSSRSNVSQMDELETFGITNSDTDDFKISLPSFNAKNESNVIEHLPDVKNKIDTSHIPEHIKDNFRKVVSANREGIWATDFPAFYENKCNKTFDLHSLGFTDLASLIDSLPDIFVRKDIMGLQRDWIIYPANLYEDTNTQMNIRSPKSNVLLMEMIISNTRSILQAYPEGVKLKDFIGIYSINITDHIPLLELGFDTIEHLLLSCASRVPLVIKGSDDGKTLHYVEFNNVNLSEASSPAVLQGVPYDVAPLDTHIEVVELPPDFTGDQYNQIFTTHITNPGYFYIQLKTEDNSEALENLYNSIHQFYKGSQSELYLMNSAHIVEGLTCIAMWPEDRTFYRVTIQTVLSQDRVKVFYFDYGTMEDISVSLLRYIKTDYIHIPAQAIKAQLAYVKPPNGASNYDPKSKVRMLQLCKDVCLMAKIEAIEDDGTLSLILCDTSQEQDIYINDVLMEEGLVDCMQLQEQPQVPDALDPALQAHIQIYHEFMARNPEAYLSMMQNLHVNPQSPPGYPPLAPSTQLPYPLFNQPTYPMVSQPTQVVQKDASLYAIPAPQERKPGTSVQSANTSDVLAGEVFGEDDDDMFEEFYNKTLLVSKRYVKRIQTRDGYIFNILIVEAELYVSSGDISALFWTEKESDYLLQRLRHRETVLTSLTLSETSNEEMFAQFRRFHVKGVQKQGNSSHLLIYPLSSMIQILNMFGHPSVELRQDILKEIQSFDPHDPSWQELFGVEVPGEEETRSLVTDDEKINRLCLHDLNAMKDGIHIRKLQLEKNISGPSREMDKLDTLLHKVVSRIQHIKQICSFFDHRTNSMVPSISK